MEQYKLKQNLEQKKLSLEGNLKILPKDSLQYKMAEYELDRVMQLLFDFNYVTTKISILLDTSAFQTPTI